MREGESRFGNRAVGPPLAAMNSTVEDTAKAVLERVGVDDRAAFFLLLMSGIAAGTCVVGTLILMLATYRSGRALLGSSEGRQEPSVVGAPASPQDVRLTLPSEPLGGPQTQPQQVSPKRRFRQVLATFFGTFGLCVAVVVDGIIHNTLSKDTGLSWESYTLLLTTGCCWMLIQAGVLAVQLEPGRGYSFTSFGEAMLGGIAPFVADSFDTLKDTLFGGFCFLSEKSGLHVLGGISWAYLALFHVCLMFQGRFLAELFSNHLSVFALATRDLKSSPPRLSRAEKAMALIGKQLARTKLASRGEYSASWVRNYFFGSGRGERCRCFVEPCDPSFASLSFRRFLRESAKAARWLVRPALGRGHGRRRRGPGPPPLRRTPGRRP